MRCNKCGKYYKDNNDKEVNYCNSCGGKLIKDNEVKEEKKNKDNDNNLLTITGIVMIIILFVGIGFRPFTSFVSNFVEEVLQFNDPYYDDEFEDEEEICDKIDWNDIQFKKYFITKRELVGEIEVSDEEDGKNQYIYLCNYDYDDYLDLKEEFIKIGFNRVEPSDEDSYIAYNKENYYLELISYVDSVAIYMKEPKKLSNKVEWPTSGPATKIPKPDFNISIGKILDNNERNFIIIIGNVTLNDYNNYVKLCKEKGFNINYYDENHEYNANDDNGTHITINYSADNTITIKTYSITGYGRNNNNNANKAG